MGSLTDSNACYGGDFEGTDFIGGGLGGTYLTPGQCGGGGKRGKRVRTKKRGSSKRKNRRVSTLRKKRGSSKRKNRGSFKRRKHSKRDVVQSIMKGLGEKRKSRKKSIKGGIGEEWLADRGKQAKKREKQAQKEQKQMQKEAKQAQKEVQKEAQKEEKQNKAQTSNPFMSTQYKRGSPFSSYSPEASKFEELSTKNMSKSKVNDPYSFVSIGDGIGQ